MATKATTVLATRHEGHEALLVMPRGDRSDGHCSDHRQKCVRLRPDLADVKSEMIAAIASAEQEDAP
jgi:hypothetical protein